MAASDNRRADARHQQARDRHIEEATAAILVLLAAMRADILPDPQLSILRRLIPDWRRRYSAFVATYGKAAAADIGQRVADELTPDPDAQTYTPKTGEGRIEEWADLFGPARADDVASAIEEAITEGDDEQIEDGIDAAIQAKEDEAEKVARNVVNTSANLGATDAAEAEGAAFKIWRTTSDNPRSSHRALHGESVAIDERFSNGMRYPGAPGPPEEVVNCRCTLRFGGTRD